MSIHGKNIIAGVAEADGDTIYNGVRAQDGEKLEPVFHAATDEEIHKACKAAAEALAEANADDYTRIEKLLNLTADYIEELGEVLIDRCMEETGLPEARLLGERGRTCGQLRMFANVVKEGTWLDARIDTAQPDRAPIPKPDLRMVLVPLGPIAVFGASNFPLAFSVAGGDTASALAAGNPVVVKAHPAHPGTSELVATAITRAVKDAGLPAGWFSLVHGVKPETSLQLVTHPAIKAVGFTGSLQAGRAIHDAAAARPEPIPVYAEMGSVNPVFFLPGAVKERGEQLAMGYAGSIALGAGQFCTNPGLGLALQDEYLDAFVATLTTQVAASPVQTMLHKGIAENYCKALFQLSEHAEVNTLASSPVDGSQTGASLLLTTGAAILEDESLSEEVFGPSSLLARCASKDELLQIAANLDGQLTATIHGTEEDLAEYAELVTHLRSKVGRLIFNAFPTGVEVCPSMQHGGPYPAASNSLFTSVGTGAIRRFARPVSYQGWPNPALPAALQDSNPLGLWRQVNGQLSKDAVSRS
jgi:NADP-dependent aldehyde dehydrogenase